jgi:hypothetical protein
MNDLSQTKPEEKAGGSRMYRFFNRYRKYILILIDACIAALAYLTPFLLSGIHAAKLQWYVEQVPLYVLIFVTTFILMGVYRNIWRYAGIEVGCQRCFSGTDPDFENIDPRLCLSGRAGGILPGRFSKPDSL